MANHKSALKRIRQNEKRRIRNKDVRSNVRTTVKKFDAAITAAIEGGNFEAAEQLCRKAESDLHRAVSKGVMPRARAARKSSRLALRLNAARAAQAAQAEQAEQAAQ